MGDEGLQIYNVNSRKAARVDFILWSDADFVEKVDNAIVKGCKRASIIVLNDMVEQHYRKERVPKVSIADQANVLKRRLNIAFPNYRVRAALKLKDKKAPTAGDKKGIPYLFAAVPASDSFNKVLEAIRTSMAPVIGFYLLPIESSAMLRALSRKLAKSKSFVPMWTIFVGQHHNGGLRQIVTRNGELALTRLTPIVDTDVEPEMWAKELSGELDATMSYLSRFGYQPTDGLDVVISTNETSKEHLEKIIQVDADIHLLTAQEISKVLGAKIGPQEDYRYADPIHAACLGKQKKFKLPLQSVSITQLTQPRKIASLLTMVLLAGIAYFGYTAFNNWTKSSDVKNQLVVAQQQVQSISEEYDIELDRQKTLGFDFRLVNNAIDIHNQLEKSKLKPLRIIEDIGKTLDVDIRLDRLSFEKVTPQRTSDKDFDERYDENGNIIESTAPNDVMKATLVISFPSSIQTDISVKKVNQLREKLGARLMGYEVSIQKQVADLSYTGNFTGSAGVSAPSQTPESYEAIIEITGEIR